MGKIGCPARIGIVLCLFVFQAQLFAASVIGCRHAVDPASEGVDSAGCHFHASAGDQPANPDTGHLPKCQKCALHCTLGTQGPLTSSFALSAVPTRSVLQPSSSRHFYRFSAERFLKPPISRPL